MTLAVAPACAGKTNRQHTKGLTQDPSVSSRGDVLLAGDGMSGLGSWCCAALAPLPSPAMTAGVTPTPQGRRYTTTAKSHLSLISLEADELGMEAQAAIDYIASTSKAEIQRLMVEIRNNVAKELKGKAASVSNTKAA